MIILLFALHASCITASAGNTTLLSLEEAIRFSLKNNISIMSYYDSLDSTRLSVELEQSEFQTKITPNISFGTEDGGHKVQTYEVNFQRKNSYGAVFGATFGTDITQDSPEGYVSSATLSVTQPLLRGAGKVYNTASLLGAKEGQVQSYRDTILAKQDLIINCISSYCGIIEYQLMYEAYRMNYERAKKLLEQANVKLEMGTVSKMDVYRAEIALLQSKNNLITYEESISSAKDNFKLLLGMRRDEEIVLTDKEFDYHKEEIELSAAIDSAINNRLELLKYYDNIKVYERDLEISRNNLQAPLDLTLYTTFLGDGNAFSESVNLDEESWGVSVSSSFDLERKREQVDYKNRVITLNRARRELKLYEDEIIIEVKGNFRNVNQSLERITLQKKSVLESEKQLEYTLMRYAGGETDNLQVIEAEENVIQAKIQYYSAITNYIVSLFKLKKSMGTLDVVKYEEERN